MMAVARFRRATGSGLEAHSSATRPGPSNILLGATGKGVRPGPGRHPGAKLRPAAGRFGRPGGV